MNRERLRGSDLWELPRPGLLRRVEEQRWLIVILIVLVIDDHDCLVCLVGIMNIMIMIFLWQV